MSVRARGQWLSIVSDFSLTFVIVVNLIGVVVFDAGDECVEQLEELRGGLVGETRKQEGQDDCVTFHWTSSRAAWTCSVLICLSLASAAAESA